MNIDEFVGRLEELFSGGLDLSGDFVDLVEKHTDLDIEKIDYLPIYKFFYKEMIDGVNESKLKAFINMEIEEGMIVEKLYSKYCSWANSEGDPIMSRISFGKFVAECTNFSTKSQYISSLGKTRRVYIKKE